MQDNNIIVGEFEHQFRHYVHFRINILEKIAQSAGAVEYIDCFSATDGEVPVMLELWGMRSTPSLPSLPVSL